MSSPVPLNGDPGGLSTESRIGTVVLATPNAMFVDVGGTTLEVAFELPFTADAIAPPAAGTVVRLTRMAASWVASGRIFGAGSNAVVNPSFEDSGAGSQPSNWQVYNISGASVSTVVDVADAPDGDLAAQVFSNQVSSQYMYSAPIPVSVGEVWSLAAFVGAEYFGGGVQTADAALVSLWFANDTNLYPTTSNPDILAQATLDIPQHPPYRTLSGTVTAPVTGFMRVCCQSNIAAPGQALIWDNISARRA